MPNPGQYKTDYLMSFSLRHDQNWDPKVFWPSKKNLRSMIRHSFESLGVLLRVYLFLTLVVDCRGRLGCCRMVGTLTPVKLSPGRSGFDTDYLGRVYRFRTRFFTNDNKIWWFKTRCLIVLSWGYVSLNFYSLLSVFILTCLRGLRFNAWSIKVSILKLTKNRKVGLPFQYPSEKVVIRKDLEICTQKITVPRVKHLHGCNGNDSTRLHPIQTDPIRLCWTLKWNFPEKFPLKTLFSY